MQSEGVTIRRLRCDDLKLQSVGSLHGVNTTDTDLKLAPITRVCMQIVAEYCEGVPLLRSRAGAWAGARFPFTHATSPFLLCTFLFKGFIRGHFVEPTLAHSLKTQSPFCRPRPFPQEFYFLAESRG